MIKAETKNLLPQQKNLCINHACKQAAQCLRFQYAQQMPPHINNYTILNPNHLQTVYQDECPYFCSMQKVRFAKGFVLWLESLSKKESKAAADALRMHYTYRTYYRMRNGERMLSPNEQATLQKIIKQHGINTPIVFDAYHEEFAW